MTSTPDLGAPVGQWNALIRRARIGRERKAAALVVSSYARADGTRIHCGVSRLAVDLEVSYSTARRYLAWLREAGLIELVRAGSRRRALSDEYRLIFGPDVLEHLDVLDPSTHKALSEGIRDAVRDGARERGKRFREKKQRSTEMHTGAVDNSDQRSAMVSVEESGSDGDQRSPRRALKTAINAQIAPDQRSPMGEPPSPLRISPSKPISPNTDDGDLRTDLAVVGAPQHPETSAAVVVEIFPGASREPPYRPPPRRRWSTRGQDAIAEAQARCEAARQAHRRKEAT